MSDHPAPVYRPIETRRRGGVPPWLLLVTGLLFVGAVAYGALNLTPPGPPLAADPGASPPPGEEAPEIDVAQAEALIEANQCQACHGADLGGQADFPSLLDVAEGPVSENLQELAAAHPDDWAVLWIAGDAPEVADLDRRGMPAFADQLSRDEIELIVEYLKRQ